MAIARVQSTTANSGAPSNTTSLVLTFGAATTAGNTVMLAVATTNTLDMKATSTHGIFSEVNPTAIDGTTTTAYTKLFYGIMFGADTTITLANIGGAVLGQISAIAVEYSGTFIIPENIPVALGSSSTNAANTGNLANTNANALYVGVICVKTQTATQNTTWATNNVAPFNLVAQTSTNNASANTLDRAIAYLDAIVATSATRGANINHGFGTNRYASLIATFDQAVTGGGIRTAGHGGLAA